MLVVVCGVSGVGKTTIGKLLAEALDLRFRDADAFHPTSNIEKMARGMPLSDADRWPWLQKLADNLHLWAESGGAVLACSALKGSYREVLASKCGARINWIALEAPEAVIAERLQSRRAHFFNPRLLISQLRDFEVPDHGPPDYGLTVDATASPQEIVSHILEALRGS